MPSTSILGRIGKAIGLTLFAAWSLVPIAMIVMSSFKADRDIFCGAAALAVHADARQLRDAVARAGATSSRACANSLIVTRGRDPARRRWSRRWPASPIRATRGRGLAGQRVLPDLHPPDPADRHHAAAVPGGELRSGSTTRISILILLYATFFVSLGTHGDAHLHRPDPARARRGGDESTAPRRSQIIAQ